MQSVYSVTPADWVVLTRVSVQSFMMTESGAFKKPLDTTFSMSYPLMPNRKSSQILWQTPNPFRLSLYYRRKKKSNIIYLYRHRDNGTCRQFLIYAMIRPGVNKHCQLYVLLDLHIIYHGYCRILVSSSRVASKTLWVIWLRNK